MSGLAEAIEVARRAQGLTQTQLAERVGITQAALSRYENGLREPDDDTLERIASSLGVTADLLRDADRVEGGLAVDAHMRRRATAKASAWQRFEARLNMHRLHTTRLFEEVQMRAPQTLPTFDPLETSPADAARLVRMQWKVPVGPVRGLTQWLESAGIIVVVEDQETPRVDAMSQWRGHPIMLVNGRLPMDRRRFTMAHELGHLTLHSNILGDDIEEEANAFASEFLMPAEVIRPQLRKVTLAKLVDLKRVWLVSVQALIERAYSLGTISASQRTSLYKQVSARGWRTAEPASDAIPPEHPQLTRSIAEAFEARGFSAEDIAAVTGYAVDRADNPFRLERRPLRAV
jgi:Zn-dependent peptidase ImmA (M78 family)/transcriptional regulator with XRE-family HTH domain